MNLKYREPAKERYFSSLPPAARSYINRSGVEISTYGELMQIGEHFRHSMSAGHGEKS